MNPKTDARVRVGRWMLLLGLLALPVSCMQNEKATKKCKSDNASAESCEKCCKNHKANGYTYVNGECGCLGG